MTIRKTLIGIPLLVIILLLPLGNLCASAGTDSLKLLYENETSDSGKAYLTRVIARSYLFKNLDSSILYLRKSLNHAKLAGRDHLALVYEKLGRAYSRMGYNDSLIFYAIKAEELYSEQGDSSKLMRLKYNSFAKYYTSISEFQKAEEKLFEALEYFTLHENHKYISIVYSYLRTLESRRGNHKKALFYANKNIDAINNTDIKKKLVQKRNYAIAQQNLGGVYEKLEDYENAVVCYHKAYEIYNELKQTLLIVRIEAKLAEINLKLGEFEKAEKFAMKAFVFGEKNKDYSTILHSAEVLYQLHKRNRNFANALLYHELYAEAWDTLENRTNSAELHSLAARFDSEKTEQENDKLKAQIDFEKSAKENQKLLVFITFTGAMIVLVMLVLILRSRKKFADLNLELEKTVEKRTSELQKVIHDSGERVKELGCLYTVSQVTENTSNSIIEVLQVTAAAIPPGWHYPDITTGRVTYQEDVATSENFETSEWCQQTKIQIDGEEVGEIEVFYTREMPDLDIGPFMNEEQHLIEALARMIAGFIKRKKDEEDLKNSNLNLENLVQERTSRLEDTLAEMEVINNRLYSQNLALNQSAIVVFTDLKGNITAVNELFCRISGYSEEELIGNNQKIVNSGYHTREFWKEMWSTIGKGKSWRGEIRNRSKSGNVYWVDTVIVPISEGDNKHNGYLAIRFDVTEKKLIEETLKTAEEKSRLILNSASEGIFGTDTEGKIIFVNPAVSNILGYSREELLGVSAHDLFHYQHEDGSVYPKNQCHMFRAYTEAKESRVDDEVLWKKDGNSIPVEYSATPIEKNGELIGSVITFSDITERKRTEAELWESHKNFRRVLESAPVGLAIVDFEESRPLMVNNAICDIFEVDYDEALQMDTKQAYINTRDRLGIVELLKKHGKIENMEMEFRKLKSGDLFWAVFSMVPIKYFEKDALIVSYIDVTEMKKLQNRFEKAKEEAEAATEAKSQFLATMSHEIRTPMNAIIGLSNLALKTKLDKKQLDYVLKIDKSAHTLLGIINDILDFSKIEAGKLDIEKIDFDLYQVLETVSAVNAQKAFDKGIEFIYNIAPGVPIGLIGDPLRIGQILTNFCSNAIKFTEKGEVFVYVEKFESTEEDVLLRFSVTDTGIGLTDIQIKKLFKAFQQADTSTTRKFGGTGLGLTISKRLAELMGGEVGVKSVNGEGSTFYFTARAGISKNVVQCRFDDKEISGKKAIVCDDNLSTQTVVGYFLERFSFKVKQVDDGSKLLELLHSSECNECDLLLIDLKMPVLDGLETLLKLKKESVIIKKKILMIPYGLDENLIDLKKFGIDGTIAKPVAPSLLYNKILELFGKEVSFVKQAERGNKFKEELKELVGAKILLVEDNDINQQVATELLESSGFSVEIADNGLIGYEMVKNSGVPSKYSIVLMDLQMPVMDGYNSTRNIRKLPEYDSLPIVAMTADAMVGIKEKCLNAGMMDFVSKPIDPDEVFGALVRWINKDKISFSDTLSNGSVIEEKEEDIVLTGIKGLNIEEGLSRVNGNKKLFLKLLGRFYESGQTFEEDLTNALSANDNEKAVRIAHTLKGVSGNIGAIELFNAAKELESSLIAGHDTYTEHLNKTSVKLNEVLEGIHSVITPESEDINQTFSETELKEKLIKLEELIKDYDPDALTLLEELNGSYGSTEEFKELKEQLTNYEFEEALELLNNIIVIKEL